MCVSVVVLKRTQDNSTTPFFSLKKKSNDRRSRGRIKRNGKRKEKKMVQEMLSFLEGRFGGQSFWWGGGGVLLDLEVETQSPVFMGVFVERKERLLL